MNRRGALLVSVLFLGETFGYGCIHLLVEADNLHKLLGNHRWFIAWEQREFLVHFSRPNPAINHLGIACSVHISVNHLIWWKMIDFLLVSLFNTLVHSPLLDPDRFTRIIALIEIVGEHRSHKRHNCISSKTLDPKPYTLNPTP